MTPRILLVDPLSDDPIDNYSRAAQLPMVNKRAFMAPLALATLAALTPDAFEVAIWDEKVRGRVDRAAKDKDLLCDVVGVTGYHAHIRGTNRIGRFFRKRGVMTVVGGPGVSSIPEAYRQTFDCLFLGEVEHTWMQFLEDWRRGAPRSEYRQITKPDLSASVMPRWDLISEDLPYYFMGGVQTTRGCPFDCEFCDVIFLYGRTPRSKQIERVMAEVDALQHCGVGGVFFCDDNFIGRPRYAKDLLRELVALNRTFTQPLAFSTQITLNVARDEEILGLLADANFDSLYIGIETPNQESLRETNKPQNYKTDMLVDIHLIQSYGLPVRAGMVVGFDHDDRSIFDRQFDFIQQSSIPIATFNMLKAPVGTKLWSRLAAEGRVLVADNELGDVDSLTYSNTNVIPKMMSRRELMEGYVALQQRVADWGSFASRMHGFVASVRRVPAARLAPPAAGSSAALVTSLIQALDDPVAEKAILGLLFHTGQQAPFLYPKVFGLILQQVGVTGMALDLAATLARQIQLEDSLGDLGRFVERRPVVISPEFRDDFAHVFPEILARVAAGLDDPTQVPAVLVEVFTDLLVHYGTSLGALADHHIAELMELADRAIAASNRAADRGHVHLVEDIHGPHRARQLCIETLKSVERDLRERSATAADRSRLAGVSWAALPTANG
jgi:radical SAM superfamily enzyme YgiQ (UPF0313 family)